MKLSKKKILALVGLGLCFLPLILTAVPMYLCANVRQTGAETYYYGNFYDAASHLPASVNVVALWVLVGLNAALFCIAAFFFARCVKDKPLVGDKEDKHFVFGYFFYTASNAFYALICVGGQSFVPMAVGILSLFVGIGMIVYHFKNLSDI